MVASLLPSGLFKGLLPVPSLPEYGSHGPGYRFRARKVRTCHMQSSPSHGAHTAVTHTPQIENGAFRACPHCLLIQPHSKTVVV